MKRLILLILFSQFFTAINAQPWLDKLPDSKAGTYSFYDYQKAFYDYWEPFNVDNKGYYIEKGKRKKASGWKQFHRWEWDMEGQIDPKTGAFPKKSAQEIYNAFKKANPTKDGSKAANWSSVGPNSSDGGYAGVGRINCIAFHPSDNGTYWVGAPAGGLWMTTDNGSSWECLTDNNDVLGVSDIIIPSNYSTSNTIYIATGDRDGWDNNSVGVLKSTDSGVTWSSTGINYSLEDSKMATRLLLDPNDDNTIIAATSNGVFKTTDGGSNWSTQLSSVGFIDMEYKPGDFNTLYGSTTSGDIYVSTDGGSNWTQTYNNSSARRVELAVTQANPSVLYALAAGSDNGFYAFYKSTDNGSNFTEQINSSSINLMGWDANGGDSGGQGWYDLSLAASPSDENVVLVGGVNTWKSIDGGTNWSIVNHWYGAAGQAVHADKHMLRYRSNGDLFECNDGGVYISTNDGDGWTDKTDGMIISQMYKLGVSQSVSGEVITGLQDNGTKLISSGTWADVKGGDGMECLIDYSDVNIQYGTYVNGQISRTTDHWVSATDIEPSSGNWVTPYIIDPQDPNTIYAGYEEIYKTTDRGDSWTTISSLSSGNFRAMAIAPSNNQVLYVSTGSNIWATTDGGSSWDNINNSLPLGSSQITYIAVKGDNENTVWVTLSGYNSDNVYESTNGGSSWTNISAGLPAIPAYSIVQNKQSTGEVQLYAGTELGVYFKKGTDNWIEFNTGLPNVKIGELEIYYDAALTNSKLYAATYGRGLWVSTVEAPNNDLANVTTGSPASITHNSATVGGEVISEGASAITERGIVWNLTGNPTTADNKIVDGSVGTGEYSTPLSGLSAETTYYVKAYAINSHGTAYGVNVSFTTLSESPEIETSEPSNITSSTAIVGGDISYEGASAITERGIVWNLTGAPTTSDNKIVEGSTSTGTFTVSMAGLNSSTKYYVKSFATNAQGTSYGSEISFVTLCDAIASLPYLQNFDGFTLSSEPDCSNPEFEQEDCWMNEHINDQTDWAPWTGSTISSSTGPSDDITGGGKYLYTEASGCTNLTAYLKSPAFDFSTSDNQELSFYYNMYGGSMGSLQVDLYYDGTWHNAIGVNWGGTVSNNISGNQGEGWNKAIADISAADTYTDVQIRFVATTGNGYTSDIALDNIEVREQYICTPPSTQASGVVASDVTGHEATLSWTSEGEHVIVVGKKGDAVGIAPENGESYAANTVFGSGVDLGEGCFAIYTGTGETVSITNLNKSTNYIFAVYKYNDSEKCYNLISPATVNFTTDGACQASGGGDEYIDGVVLEGITTSGTGANGYEDFTSFSTDLEPGVTYTLSISNGEVYSDDDLGVWIDFNDNDSFNDDGENVVCAVNDGADGDYNLSIPSDAILGSHTMRIRIKYSGSDCGIPCGETEYGEVEDYTVNIICPGNVTIENQPVNNSICDGEEAEFTVAANNAGSYQWQKDGVDISGETTDTLTINSASENDEGDYTCVVNNACSSVTTNSASLLVKPATQIITHPVGTNANIGDDITFSVVADGENLIYQWRFEGTGIDGATEDSYQILSVIKDNAGEYTVKVSGDCGEEISEIADLSVTTSIEELSDFGIKLYPNPSHGIFKVSYGENSQGVDVVIYNLEGKVVYQDRHNSSINVIDISGNAKGMYIVKFNIENKSVVSNIILK